MSDPCTCDTAKDCGSIACPHPEVHGDWSQIVSGFCAELERTIGHDRNGDYGPPRDNHATTAAYWRIAIFRRYGIHVPFDGIDVCQMNRLQKESRAGESPTKRDHYVDIAGFAGNALDCFPCDEDRLGCEGTDD